MSLIWSVPDASIIGALSLAVAGFWMNKSVSVSGIFMMDFDANRKRQKMAINIMEALKLGGIVDNPTELKKWQLMANIFAAILMVLIAIATVILSAFGKTLPVFSETAIIAVSSGLAALWLLINNLVATITTRKLGSKPK